MTDFSPDRSRKVDHPKHFVDSRDTLLNKPGHDHSSGLETIDQRIHRKVGRCRACHVNLLPCEISL